jgi:hypothetical protein
MESCSSLWNREHTPGVYSFLRLDELALLASRDARAIKRYGHHQVALELQRVLAVTLQSLGFGLPPIRWTLALGGKC